MEVFIGKIIWGVEVEWYSLERKNDLRKAEDIFPRSIIFTFDDDSSMVISSGEIEEFDGDLQNLRFRIPDEGLLIFSSVEAYRNHSYK